MSDDKDERKKHAKRLKSIGINLLASIEPCEFGRVDRYCLLKANAAQTAQRCEPFVADYVDENIVGKTNRRLGEGTHGVVYGTTHNFVIKCSKTRQGESKDMKSADLREIAILRNLVHPNIIQIRQVSLRKTAEATAECNMRIVMPFFHNNLRSLFALHGKFSPQRRALYLYQLLRAVVFIHSKSVWHRDIKPENILIDENNHLVLADFGLAQGLAIEGAPRSANVVTLWYRAPELLLHDRRYGSAIDIWAVGATWLDLLGVDALHSPLFDEEFDQLMRTFLFVGVPDNKKWPEAFALPRLEKYQHYVLLLDRTKALRAANAVPRRIEETLDHVAASTDVDAHEKALIVKLLALNPKNRPSAQQAVFSAFFDGVRRQVDRDLPAAPIPTPSTVGCNQILLATELPPVGDYLSGYNSADLSRSSVERALRYLYELSVSMRDEWSTFALAASFLHRILAHPDGPMRSQGIPVEQVALTCYMIASKLDGAGAIFNSLDASEKTAESPPPTFPSRFIEIERSILTILDADVDRPTAYTFWSTFVRDASAGEEGKEGEVAEERKKRERRGASARRLVEALQNYDSVLKRGSQIAFIVCKKENLFDSECLEKYETQFDELFSM